MEQRWIAWPEQKFELQGQRFAGDDGCLRLQCAPRQPAVRRGGGCQPRRRHFSAPGHHRREQDGNQAQRLGGGVQTGLHTLWIAGAALPGRLAFKVLVGDIQYITAGAKRLGVSKASTADAPRQVTVLLISLS